MKYSLIPILAVPLITATFFCRVPLIPAQEILLDDYEEGLSDQWEQKSFKGETRYEVTVEDGQRCIKATSRSSASALYYKIKYDARKYPLIQWRWKISKVLAKGNALTKEGDDYAARVYVVFPSTFFWRTKAINYVWANTLPKGKAVPNPFTGNVIMIAVESGNELAGTWVQETRNLLKDYKKIFKKDPPRIGAVAIMTDTDNTGEEATAWYGPIRQMSQSRESVTLFSNLM